MRNLPLIYDSDDFLLGNGGFIYGTGRAFGIEAMLQYQTERLSLTASYTYTDSRRRSDGVTYPFEFQEGDNPFEGRRNKLTQTQIRKRRRMMSFVKKG
jgi:hypothetical protein